MSLSYTQSLTLNDHTVGRASFYASVSSLLQFVFFVPFWQGMEGKRDKWVQINKHYLLVITSECTDSYYLKLKIYLMPMGLR